MHLGKNICFNEQLDKSDVTVLLFRNLAKNSQEFLKILTKIMDGDIFVKIHNHRFLFVIFFIFCSSILLC